MMFYVIYEGSDFVCGKESSDIRGSLQGSVEHCVHIVDVFLGE